MKTLHHTRLLLGLVALLAAMVVAGCGAEAAVEPVIVELAVAPSGVTLGGQPVDMARLDARLSEAHREGERLRLSMDWRTPSPSTLQLYSRRQIERAQALQARVLAAASRAGVAVVTFAMPVAGDASPSPVGDP